MHFKAESYELEKVNFEERISKEQLADFLRQVALNWSRVFIFLDVFSTVYFVFVSAIPDEEVTFFLTQIGFRADISQTLSDAFNSIWTVFGMLLLLLFSRCFARLRGQSAEALSEALRQSKVQIVEMEDTLASLTPNLRTFYSATLQSMLRKVSLEVSPKVRISAYLPSSDKENFMPVGRYSHNAGYRAQGRTLLPFTQGCIGEAWTVGKCEWREMSKRLDTRRNKSEELYNIPNTTFDALGMKTVSIGAYRIEDNSRLPVGLVVIEADEHDVIDFAQFVEVLEEEKTNFQRLISSTHQYLTDPNLAKEAGV